MKKLKVTATTLLLMAVLGLAVSPSRAWISAAEEPSSKPALKGAAVPKNQPKKQELRAYEIQTKLCNAPQPAGTVVDFPAVLTQQKCLSQCEVHLAKVQDVVQFGASEPIEVVESGLGYSLRVKRLDAQRVLLDVCWQDTHMERGDDDTFILMGQTMRAFRKVDLDKNVQLVTAKDDKGQPKQWLQIKVRELSAEEAAPLGVPPVVRKSPATRLVAPQPLPPAVKP
jgi:hypothetical protein